MHFQVLCQLTLGPIPLMQVAELHPGQASAQRSGQAHGEESRRGCVCDWQRLWARQVDRQLPDLQREQLSGRQVYAGDAGVPWQRELLCHRRVPHLLHCLGFLAPSLPNCTFTQCLPLSIPKCLNISVSVSSSSSPSLRATQYRLLPFTCSCHESRLVLSQVQPKVSLDNSTGQYNVHNTRIHGVFCMHACASLFNFVFAAFFAIFPCILAHFPRILAIS